MRKGKAINSEREALALDAIALRKELAAAVASTGAALAEAAVAREAAQSAASAAQVQKVSAKVH